LTLEATNNMTEPQLMWLDIIHAILLQPKFDLKLGDLNYVFRNIIAKYVSSSEVYRVSKGVEILIDRDEDLKTRILNSEKINLKAYFYGGKSSYAKIGIKTLFEHSIPAAVIRDQLLLLREKIFQQEEFRTNSLELTKTILLNSGFVVVVLQEENRCLLRKSMPIGWTYGSDPFDRYHKASPHKVILSEKYFVHRDHHICR
jgi:hypothetical protein